MMKRYTKSIANYITASRILFSIALLFVSVFSMMFYILYLLAGLTDMIDGTVARKTNSVSDFGSKLDTVADVTFVIACIIKILPVLEFPIWVLIWTSIIAIIKITNIVIGFVLHRKFIAVHNIANKSVGGCLFLFPLTINMIPLTYTTFILCVAATLAAVLESWYIKKY